MADRGIIFSAAMIRALLDGRKSMTRRLLSLRGYPGFSEFGPSDTPGFDWHFRRADLCWCDVKDARLQELLPYAPGDRLWVRETFVTGFDIDDEYGRPVGDRKVWYRATDIHLTWYDPETETSLYNPPWRPSIHMPRWASRLTLTVTDVRVQRVQEISEEDAKSEGVRPVFSYPGWDDTSIPPWYRWGFCEVWDALNAKCGYGWDRNPWVVALTFTVERRNIDAE